MPNVNVRTEDLLNLQKELEKNALRFDELRERLGKSLNSIVGTEWEDAKAEEFQALFFSESAPALESLSDIMRTFSKNDLSRKIEILNRYLSKRI